MYLLYIYVNTILIILNIKLILRMPYQFEFIFINKIYYYNDINEKNQ